MLQLVPYLMMTILNVSHPTVGNKKRIFTLTTSFHLGPCTIQQDKEKIKSVDIRGDEIKLCLQI